MRPESVVVKTGDFAPPKQGNGHNSQHPATLASGETTLGTCLVLGSLAPVLTLVSFPLLSFVGNDDCYERRVPGEQALAATAALSLHACSDARPDWAQPRDHGEARARPSL